MNLMSIMKSKKPDTKTITQCDSILKISWKNEKNRKFNDYQANGIIEDYKQ